MWLEGIGSPPKQLTANGHLYVIQLSMKIILSSNKLETIGSFMLYENTDPTCVYQCSLFPGKKLDDSETLPKIGRQHNRPKAVGTPIFDISFGLGLLKGQQEWTRF